MSECSVTCYYPQFDTCVYLLFIYVIQSKKFLCRAFSKSQNKGKKKPKNLKLTHATKVPVSWCFASNSIRELCFSTIINCVSLISSQCLTQPPDNTCGFYAANNLMIAMQQTFLVDDEVWQIFLLSICCSKLNAILLEWSKLDQTAWVRFIFSAGVFISHLPLNAWSKLP